MSSAQLTKHQEDTELKGSVRKVIALFSCSCLVIRE